MGDSLEIVALAVGEVVHGVDVPFRACAVVGVLDDAIHYGVAEVHVGRRHVDFGAEHSRSFGEFARVHTHEQVEIFLYRTRAVGALGAGRGGRALLGGNFFRGLVVDISLPLLDHPHGKVEKLGEIVGGVIFAVAPVEAEPVDVLADGIHIFGIFLNGVGIVETEIAGAAEFFSNTEIHADGLGVADMEVAVGLGRETRVEASAVFAGVKVVGHNLLYKIQTARCGFVEFVFFHFGHNAKGNMISNCCFRIVNGVTTRQSRCLHALKMQR